VSGSGISWAISKSAHRSREITTPAPTTQFFTGRMPFLSPNQQRQSIYYTNYTKITYKLQPIKNEREFQVQKPHFPIIYQNYRCKKTTVTRPKINNSKNLTNVFFFFISALKILWRHFASHPVNPVIIHYRQQVNGRNKQQSTRYSISDSEHYNS